MCMAPSVDSQPISLFVFCAVFLVASPPAEAFVDHAAFETVRECVACHPRTLPTHERKIPDHMTKTLPLSRSGRMRCTTCHDCISGTCILREQGTDLCAVCHDCSQGMACMLGIVHLGNAADPDLVARGCLSCHDGSVGSDARGGHHVSERYVVSGGFKKLSDGRVRLVDGKVACVSCHNPYHPEGQRLVTDGAESRLCLSCHSR